MEMNQNKEDFTAVLVIVDGVPNENKHIYSHETNFKLPEKCFLFGSNKNITDFTDVIGQGEIKIESDRIIGDFSFISKERRYAIEQLLNKGIKIYAVPSFTGRLSGDGIVTEAVLGAVFLSDSHADPRIEPIRFLEELK